jgi:hypothetical protein
MYAYEFSVLVIKKKFNCCLLMLWVLVKSRIVRRPIIMVNYDNDMILA